MVTSKDFKLKKYHNKLFQSYYQKKKLGRCKSRLNNVQTTKIEQTFLAMCHFANAEHTTIKLLSIIPAVMLNSKKPIRFVHLQKLSDQWWKKISSSFLRKRKMFWSFNKDRNVVIEKTAWWKLSFKAPLGFANIEFN